MKHTTTDRHPFVGSRIAAWAAVLVIGVGSLALLLLTACRGTGSVTLSGRVYDKATREPVQDARIELDPAPDGAHATTDTEGRFALQVTPADRDAQLVIKHPAYLWYVRDLSLISQEVEVRIELVPSVPIDTGCSSGCP
jgi:hypothetical protein